MIQTTKYVRKPFEVEAVQVTKDNIEDVAQWCQGVIHVEGDNTRYVKVRVARVMSERQTRAYIGDWVLWAETGGYKVYNTKAFAKSFTKVEAPTELLTTSQPAT